MAERDMDEGRDFTFVIGDQSSQSHERKLRMLKRLAEALNRPVSDFFDINAEPDARVEKTDGEEPGRDS
ncbi:MAG: hypothetical protein INR70_18950 [Parafilimonas terrae]|nr:hypothetical protein [Parafilimonas terrae]